MASCLSQDHRILITGGDDTAVTGVPVTGVIAPSALAMVCPVAQAEPAELTAALAAHHVHAPLSLLYGPLTLGARLGVC